MDGAGSVCTQVSRFLDQGGLLNKFIDVQSSAELEGLEDLELEDIVGHSRQNNKVFFENLEDYFRDG